MQRNDSAVPPNQTTMKLTELALMLAIPAVGPLAFAEEEMNDTTTMPQTESMETPAKPSEAADAAVAGMPETVVTAIDDSATFQLLKSAIEAAGLTEDLTNAKTVTVFAPTDEAFRKLPPETLTALMAPENKMKLRTLLLHHVIQGEILSTSLKDQEVKTMSGDMIEIDVDGKEVEVGDAKVVNADLMTGNGVIHVIDKVVIPESLDDFADLDAD